MERMLDAREPDVVRGLRRDVRRLRLGAIGILGPHGLPEAAAVGVVRLVYAAPERAEARVGDPSRVPGVAVQVGDHLERGDRVEVPRALARHADLGDAGKRVAEHAEVPVRPRLARGPLDRRRAVAPLLRREGLEDPRGATRATDAYAQHRIAG